MLLYTYLFCSLTKRDSEYENIRRFFYEYLFIHITIFNE